MCIRDRLYTGVLQLTKEKMAETPVITGDKKVYYISMEFRIGKLLSLIHILNQWSKQFQKNRIWFCEKGAGMFMSQSP